MEQLKRKYQSMSVEARAALWFALCNFVNKGVAMIVVPLYTRLLTTEEYGTYTVFQSWLNLFVILATLEISRGHYKVGITKYEEDAALDLRRCMPAPCRFSTGCWGCPLIW